MKRNRPTEWQRLNSSEVNTVTSRIKSGFLVGADIMNNSANISRLWSRKSCWFWKNKLGGNIISIYSPFSWGWIHFLQRMAHTARMLLWIIVSLTAFQDTWHISDFLHFICLSCLSVFFFFFFLKTWMLQNRKFVELSFSVYFFLN